MVELARVGESATDWTFQTTIVLRSPIVCEGASFVAYVVQATVHTQLAFDARKQAAKILGVDPSSLTLVQNA